MKTRPFNLEEALAGKPVWHVSRKEFVENVAKVGNRFVYTIPGDGDSVYQTELDGTFNGCFEHEIILVMGTPERTFYVNLYDSPSFHYRKHLTREAAIADSGSTYVGKVYPKLNKEPIEITVEV